MKKAEIYWKSLGKWFKKLKNRKAKNQLVILWPRFAVLLPQRLSLLILVFFLIAGGAFIFYQKGIPAFIFNQARAQTVNSVNFVTPPTPADGATQLESTVLISVSTNIVQEHSAFIDFDNDLVGWWRFDNETDFLDHSSHGFNAANQGSSFSASGKRGGARSFDGVSNYISVPDNADLSGGSKNFTVAVWFNSSNVALPQQQIIDKSFDSSTKDYSLAIDANSRLRFGYEMGANNWDVSNGAGATILSNNTWYHGAFTFNQGTKEVKLYLNGSLEGTWVLPTDLPDSSSALSIGRRGGTYNTQFFNGLIDEAMIFNRALSTQEIKALYNAGQNALSAEITNLSKGVPHTYKGYAIDSSGNISQTEQRSVTISSEAPVVKITNPSDNGVVNAASISLSYTLTNAALVDHLHFQLDSQPIIEEPDKDGSVNITGITDGYHTIRAIMVDASNKQVADSTVITIFGDISNQPRDWYVRPPATPGTYGNETGTSYDNAWNGILNVKWGALGVGAGDNLYICGSHVQKGMTRWKIGASGFSDVYPITIRMDCNDKNPGYEEGVLWGYLKDSDAGITWSSIENGIYTTTNIGWTRGIIQDINGFEHILLNQSNASDLNGQSGAWYRNSTSGITYLKTTDGSNPTGRIYIHPGDWMRLDLETSSYIKFYKCNIYGFELRNTAPSSALNPDHYTFDSCDLQYGGTLIPIYAGNDFWTIRNSELHNAENGIYTMTPGNMYNLLVENNYIHDIGTNNFYHKDAHGVGVQNGMNFIIQNNTFNNTGEAITFWSGNYDMKNNTIRYNFIKDVHAKSNTNGGGIVVAGNTTPGKRSGYYIYGNIILNPGLDTVEDYQGGGITVNIGGDADLRIYNNVIYNEGGSHTNGRGAIRVYNSQSYPLQNVYIYNNIIYEPNYRYIFLSGGGTPWENVYVDNNIYYPAKSFSAFVFGAVTNHDSNSIFADPLFISSNPQVASDFKLQSSSPAIDKGKDVSLATDYAGTVIPQGSAPDIGAYEYAGTPTPPPPPVTCTPSWSCAAWSTCSVGGAQTRTCTDTNACGVTTGKPAESQSCIYTPPVCTPNWSCVSWSVCSTAGLQTRTCADTNACGVTTGKPAESQSCIYTPPVINCIPSWSCASWSVCSPSKTQNRICTDTKACNTSSGKPSENQACVYTVTTPPPAGAIPPATDGLDKTAPTLAITSPTDASMVTGPIALSAEVSDNVGIAGVRFLVDGKNYGSEDTTSPYAMVWETASYPNRSYLIGVVARDAANNKAYGQVNVILKKSATPPKTLTPISPTPTPPIVTLLSALATGNVIKTATNPAVYYVSPDNKRHLSSNEATYWTWYNGKWSDQGVKTVSQNVFDLLISSANITARSGVNLIRFQNSPRVYVVTPNSILKEIVTSSGDDSVAKQFFGNDYAKRVIIIQDAFEANYTKVGSLDVKAKLPDGSLIKYSDSSTIYYINGGKRQLLSGLALTANNFKSDAVITVPASMAYPEGAAIDSGVPEILRVNQ